MICVKSDIALIAISDHKAIIYAVDDFLWAFPVDQRVILDISKIGT